MVQRSALRRRRGRGGGVGAAAALGGDGVGTAAALGETRWCCPVFGARPPKARESWGARLRRSAAARAGVASSKGARGTPLRAIFRFFFGCCSAASASRISGTARSQCPPLPTYTTSQICARGGVGISSGQNPAPCHHRCDSAGKSSKTSCHSVHGFKTASLRAPTAAQHRFALKKRRPQAHDLWAACGLPHTPPQRSRTT